MLHGFNINVSTDIIDIDEAAVGQARENKNKNVAQLEKYLLTDNVTIDAKKIISHLFKEESCDVFISHSHADEALAIQIALDLKKRGVTAFVDSTVWGSSADLLRKIDNKHCKFKNSDTYNYDERNRSTAHVHMILMGALQNMISRSPVLFFLNTENSLSIEHSIKDKNKTHSPWIYAELLFSRLIWEARSPTIALESLAKSEGTMDSVNVVHTVDTNHLHSITPREFSGWIKDLGYCESSEELISSLEKLMHPSKNRIFKFQSK